MSRPLDAVGEKLRAREDYREAEDQDYRVYRQISARGPKPVRIEMPAKAARRNPALPDGFSAKKKFGVDAAKSGLNAYNICNDWSTRESQVDSDRSDP